MKNRQMTPKNQVAAISTFVTEKCGGAAKQSQVMELVARLNGCSSWNVLSGSAKNHVEPAPQKNELFSGIVAELQNDGLVPVKGTMAAVALVLPSVFEAISTATGVDKASPMEVLRAIQVECDTVKRLMSIVEDLVSRRMGQNRVTSIPGDWSHRLVLESDGYEDGTFSVQDFGSDGMSMVSLDDVAVDEELFERLLADGVVSDILVAYPRADRYGIPDEATDEGAKAWLFQEGFAVSPDLSVCSEDSGDDSMTRMSVTLQVSDELYAFFQETLG